MEFIIGLLSGMVAALTLRAVLLEWLPRKGREDVSATPPPDRKQWDQTRNFLYYDGTVMPNIKEAKYEQ